MSIWGRRDNEPSAEEAPETQAAPRADQAPAGPDQAAGPEQAPAGPEEQDEQAPAFWRAQGEAAPQADDGDAVLIEGTVVRGGGPEEQAGMHEAGAGEPVMPAEQAGMHEAGAGEPVMPGEQAGMHEAGAGEPVMPVAPEPAAAAAASPVAAPPVPGSPAAAHGISEQRWNEIMATFVDDPRGSVKLAADTVDAAIDELVTAARARQQALTSSWQGTEADTEQLRVALRDYRTLWHQVRRIDLPGETG